MIYQLKSTMLYGAYMPNGELVERVFDADGSSSLYDLLRALLDSLDFDFDHLYEFQVRKGTYGGTPMGCDGENPTFDELNLRKGSKLKLVYDFCDDWTFDIAVIGRQEGNVKHGIELVSAIGMVEQYPNEDDWEYD